MENRKVDLSAFTKVQAEMVSKTTSNVDDFYSSRYVHKLKEYTPEEIEEIINGTSLASQQKLSRNYYDKNGLYKRVILYYATLLNYAGLLIPNPIYGTKLSNSYIKKRYYAALEYLERLNLQEVLTRMSIYTLIYGSYFGIIKTLSKDDCVIFDLPAGYARSLFKDMHGNDIVEFDVSYFDSISDESLREKTLNIYPDVVVSHYKKYHRRNKVSCPWVTLPSNIGICFTFFDDGRPLFLSIIPATIQYDEAVDTERERELDEIKKIIVQKIPHLTDGALLFEPEEALEMHKGAVDMLKKNNKNLSVLTTYADVDAIVSKTSGDNVNTSLDKMLQNVYSEAGVTGQIFAPTGTQAVPYSIKNDISLMMVLGNKYARFITYVVNTLFSNGNIQFKYNILPVSEYTKSEQITDNLKLAQSGYSFLMVSAIAGINPLELVNIKQLENEVLDMQEVLIPLSSSYTQSEGKVGAPEKPLEEKSPKTIQNEDAIDHQGGSE